jgi:chemotaxis signal transduction protein
VLRFRVSGQWIAAPLVSLRRIERLDQPLRHLPGQDAARCGVALLRGEACTVFDLGRLLGLSAFAQPRPGGYLVAAGEGTQAFYCEEMGATRLLADADVRWARAGGPHWLAGVVADDLSVLVDVARLFEVVGHE